MTNVTEIVKFDVNRQDGVKAPANGFPFLLMKAVEPPPSVNAPKEPTVETKPTTTETKTSTPTEGGNTETTVPDIDNIVKSAIAEASKAQDERIKALEGELAKVKATPIPGGPAMTTPAVMRDKAEKASKLAEAAHFVKLAEQVNDTDLKKYYKERAAACKAAV